MKSHAFITLAILITFFVLAKGATMSSDKLTFSTRALGATSVARYEFDFDQEITTSGNNVISIELPGFDSIGTLSTTAKKISGCGGAVFTVGESGTGGGADLVVTLTVGTAALAADTKCIVEFGILRNPVVYASSRAIKVGINTADSYTAAAPDHIDTIGGAPTLYAHTSTCNSGGLKLGTTATCSTVVGPLCKECKESGNSFYTEHGTGCTSSNQVRCDAMYYSDNTIDVYFNTGGIEGIAWCAAYTTGQGPHGTPANQYSFEDDPSTHIKSRNSVVIDVKDAKTDHVISLSSLQPDTPYAIYCHMDDVTMSTVLNVWTAPNTNIWGDSLVRSNVNFGDTSGTLTLTFTHGATLDNAFVIVLTTNADIFSATSGNPTCSATKDGSAFALHATAATATDLSSKKVITFTTHASTGGSTAGSEIIITCTTLLENPASAPTVNPITYTLDVTGHNIRNKRKGPKFE